jgi:hypothetical protein
MTLGNRDVSQFISELSFPMEGDKNETMAETEIFGTKPQSAK